MKKINKYLKPISLIFAVILFESVLYEAPRYINTHAHILTSAIDNKIPFIPQAVFVYISWYILLAVVPFIIYLHNKKDFYTYIISVAISALIAFIIFITFQTTVERPEFEVNNFSTLVTSIIYKLDTPALCCLPSMHCTLCFLFIIFTLKDKKYNLIYTVVITILSLAIVVSTLCIKQHVIYDVLAAILLAIISYIVSKAIVYKHTA